MPKYPNDETITAVENDFKTVHTKLRKLESIYNPRKSNLHFYPLKKADLELFRELLALSKEGLRLVHKHRKYFSKQPLYDDGMYWYDLLLMISSASLRIKSYKRQRHIPEDVIDEITMIMVDVSEYSTKFIGDMTKRNHEALGNTLYVFYNKDLIRLVKKRGRAIGLKNVKEFVKWTIKKVEEIVPDDKVVAKIVTSKR